MTAMPKSRLSEFSALLRARQAQLVGEVREKFAVSGEAPGFSNRSDDTREQAVADTLADIDVAMVTRDSDELQDIEHALERIGDGTFGDCSDCGEPISLSRLKAYPAAWRCINCQEMHERSTAHVRTTKL